MEQVVNGLNMVARTTRKILWRGWVCLLRHGGHKVKVKVKVVAFVVSTAVHI